MMPHGRRARLVRDKGFPGSPSRGREHICGLSSAVAIINFFSSWKYTSQGLDFSTNNGGCGFARYHRSRSGTSEDKLTEERIGLAKDETFGHKSSRERGIPKLDWTGQEDGQQRRPGHMSSLVPDEQRHQIHPYR